MEQTQEFDRAAALRASRREAVDNQEASPPQSEEAGAGGNVSTATWMLLFLAVGLLWCVSLLSNLILPVVVMTILNYMVVLSLWLWAEIKGLKPPSFGSSLKKAVQAAAGANPSGGVADKIPGSSLLYILTGGASPMAYLIGLWFANK